MDIVPDDPGEKLAKTKTFDAEPFRSTILLILETNSGKSFCMSSVYDVLEEKFIENGTYDKLPGNVQSAGSNRRFSGAKRTRCGASGHNLEILKSAGPL